MWLVETRVPLGVLESGTEGVAARKGRSSSRSRLVRWLGLAHQQP